MNDTILGTCSICGGPVTVPAIWMGVVPPVPTCSRCGAVAAQPQMPVIPMAPATIPASGTGGDFFMPPWTITSFVEHPPIDPSAWLQERLWSRPVVEIDGVWCATEPMPALAEDV